MVSYLRLMSAEPLKYRRSAVKGLVLGVPALFSALTFLGSLISGNRAMGGEGANIDAGWNVLGHSFSGVWLAFVVPLGVIILAALACHQMQSEGMWRAALMQPVERGSVYLAHLSGVALWVLGGTLIFSAGLLFTGLVVFGGPVHWDVVLGLPLAGWITSLPMLAVQIWLGTRIRNIAIPMAVGMGGYVCGLVGNALHIGYAFPWIYPTLIMQLNTMILFASAGIAVVLSALGAWSFVKTDTL